MDAHLCYDRLQTHPIGDFERVQVKVQVSVHLRHRSAALDCDRNRLLPPPANQDVPAVLLRRGRHLKIPKKQD